MRYAIFPINTSLNKGDVFWYKVKKEIYGAVVLDVVSKWYCIAVSEKLDDINISTAAILSSPLYTVSWFSDVELLTKRRTHICGNIDIPHSYNNRAGFILRDDGSLKINNYGQSQTWKHEFRSFYLANSLLSDFLTPSTLPKFILYE